MVGLRTSKKEALGGAQKSVFGLGVGNGVKASHAHDLPDSIAAPIVGVRIGTQNAAEICFQP